MSIHASPERMRFRFLPLAFFAASFVPIALAACGSTGRPTGEFDDPDTSVVDGSVTPVDGQTFPDGGFQTGDGSILPPAGETRDPVDCNEAKATKSYVGCDYWPTVNANTVWSIFDFAVVVSNTGKTPSDIQVTGPNGFMRQVQVPAGELRKIFLPWVPSLKGADQSECANAGPMTASVSAPNSAYHLVSSTPVIVAQFSALQYRPIGGESAGDGGAGKDWSACPGNRPNRDCGNDPFGFPITPPPCFSYSNDASLLLPSTAMTTNYRVAGFKGWSLPGSFIPPRPKADVMGTHVAITATENDTVATVRLSGTGKVLAGGVGIPATNGGGTLTLNLAKAGDVAELVTEKGDAFDISGSLITSTKPVQVIVGMPCVNVPADKGACDHIEESVMPAETLGKRYLINAPTGPKGQPVKHWVRFVGNRDATTLTYAPSKPAKCPATLQAGQVVDCELVAESFDVQGSQEFAVVSLLVGSSELGAATELNRGDPSLTTYAAVEQFRTKYLFLAPDDYDVTYADIVGEQDAAPQVDGVAVPASAYSPVANGLGVFRVKLGPGKGGGHTLEAARPVGLQVVGYGANTSYQYPGGLNLKLISIPPVPK
jgi:hypothetical protein